jgi:hypothetical protein
MERNPPKELSFWVLFAIAFVVVALWVGAGVLLYDADESTPIWGNRGTFGDMFGSINALFSGLAFAGIIFTVLLQRQELQLQRHELKLQREEIIENRKELTGQREQLEMQSKTFARQNFESTFFNLVQKLREVTGSLLEGISPTFQSVRDRSLRDVRDLKISPENLFDCVEKVVAIHIRDDQDVLDIFFQILMTVLKYVDNSDQENKRFYADVVRCSLSHTQLFCVFYATSLDHDTRHRDLRVLIEKYGLFKHLPPAYLISPEHMRAFASTAFG